MNIEFIDSLYVTAQAAVKIVLDLSRAAFAVEQAAVKLNATVSTSKTTRNSSFIIRLVGNIDATVNNDIAAAT